MTAQEVISQILSLPFEERKELLKRLEEVLRNEVQTGSYKGVSVAEVRGIIKPSEELPPDFDWKKVKEEYLIEKYM